MKFDENLNIDEILKRAIDTPYGLQINVSKPHTAQSLRRLLYHKRNKIRAAGSKKYDQLSFIAKSESLLWIVNRQAVKANKNAIDVAIKPLSDSDLPSIVNVRGKSKVGLMFNQYISD